MTKAEVIIGAIRTSEEGTILQSVGAGINVKEMTLESLGKETCHMTEEEM